MTTPATTPAPQKITHDCQPVFPCWLWRSKHRYWNAWSGLTETPDDATHWLPDSPSEPTCTPTEGEKRFSSNPHDHGMIETREKRGPFAIFAQPTHSAQEARPMPAWVYQAVTEIALHVDGKCSQAELAAIILRHFPSTPTQSQQPPVSPGSGEAMREALEACDKAFAAWQVGQIPGRHEDILALITKVRAALAQPATPPLPSGDWDIIERGLEVMARHQNGLSLRDWSLFVNAVLNLKAPPLTSGEELKKHIDRCCAILGTIRTETRPVATHEDPGALEDCWREAFDELVLIEESLAAPPMPAIGDGKDGAALIAAERVRQVEKEEWSERHDDAHSHGDLRDAAQCYLHELHYRPSRNGELGRPHGFWPWSNVFWKPTKDPVRQLVKAGALIAAEIDRLNRAAMSATPPKADAGREEK